MKIVSFLLAIHYVVYLTMYVLLENVAPPNEIDEIHEIHENDGVESGDEGRNLVANDSEYF